MNRILSFVLLIPIFSFGQTYQSKIDSIIDTKFDNGPAVSVLISMTTLFLLKTKMNSLRKIGVLSFYFMKKMMELLSFNLFILMKK